MGASSERYHGMEMNGRVETKLISTLFRLKYLNLFFFWKIIDKSKIIMKRCESLIIKHSVGDYNN